MKMTTLYAALSGALLLGAATLGFAGDVPTPAAKAVTPDKMENKTTGISQAEYKTLHEQVEADAKAAKAKCKDLKANAKDICQAEAKANEKIAKKELDLKRKGTPEAEYELAKIKAEGAYEVAKEKCEDQKGAEQTACKKQAKADETKTIADAKAARSANKTVASAQPKAPK